MWSFGGGGGRHSYLSKLNGDGVDNHGKIPIFIVLWVDYDKNEAGQLRLTFRLVSFTIVWNTFYDKIPMS